MKSATTPLRLLLCVLLLSQGGCAWWRHRHAPAADEAAQAAATGAVADVAASAPAAAAPAVVSAPTPLSEAQAKSAIALAADFYQMHTRMTARGLPDPASMNAYAAFLCPALVTAIAEARARQQQFLQAHPQEKPPLVDGDLFSSRFEGADSATALEAAASADGARVTLALSRGHGAEAQRWKDDLRLQRDGSIWCVADVEYGGDWPSARRGRLSDSLKAD